MPTQTENQVKNYIDVQITRQTSFLPRQSFGLSLFIGHTVLSPVVRVATYASITEVAAVYTTTDPEYLAAADFFAQGGNAKQLLIGYKASGETYVQALAAIQAIRDDFFAVAIQSTTPSDQTAVGAWALSQPREIQAWFRSAVADIINVVTGSDTTTVPALLKAASNNNARVTYYTNSWSSTNLTGRFPELAQMARVLTVDENKVSGPGSTAWYLQPIVGFIGDNFTTTQRRNMEDKNVEYLFNDGARTVTNGGKMAGGEWGDIMHGVAWVEARTGEAVYDTLQGFSNRLSKVPYNDEGIAVIADAVRKVLNIAVGTSFIDEGYDLTVPAVEDTLAQDRASRTLKDVRFVAKLSGAIKYVEIRGIVTV